MYKIVEKLEIKKDILRKLEILLESKIKDKLFPLSQENKIKLLNANINIILDIITQIDRKEKPLSDKITKNEPLILKIESLSSFIDLDLTINLLSSKVKTKPAT
ncbi:hypothetical protein K6025_03425 [Ehrlichia sp. JZT12]